MPIKELQQLINKMFLTPMIIVSQKISLQLYKPRTNIIRGYFRQHSKFQPHFLQATQMTFYPLGNYQLQICLKNVLNVIGGLVWFLIFCGPIVSVALFILSKIPPRLSHSGFFFFFFFSISSFVVDGEILNWGKELS